MWFHSDQWLFLHGHGCKLFWTTWTLSCLEPLDRVRFKFELMAMNYLSSPIHLLSWTFSYPIWFTLVYLFVGSVYIYVTNVTSVPHKHNLCRNVIFGLVRLDDSYGLSVVLNLIHEITFRCTYYNNQFLEKQMYSYRSICNYISAQFDSQPPAVQYVFSLMYDTNAPPYFIFFTWLSVLVCYTGCICTNSPPYIFFCFYPVVYAIQDA